MLSGAKASCVVVVLVIGGVGLAPVAGASVVPVAQAGVEDGVLVGDAVTVDGRVVVPVVVDEGLVVFGDGRLVAGREVGLWLGAVGGDSAGGGDDDGSVVVDTSSDVDVVWRISSAGGVVELESSGFGSLDEPAVSHVFESVGSVGVEVVVDGVVVASGTAGVEEIRSVGVEVERLGEGDGGSGGRGVLSGFGLSDGELLSALGLSADGSVVVGGGLPVPVSEFVVLEGSVDEIVAAACPECTPEQAAVLAEAIAGWLVNALIPALAGGDQRALISPLVLDDPVLAGLWLEMSAGFGDPLDWLLNFEAIEGDAGSEAQAEAIGRLRLVVADVLLGLVADGSIPEEELDRVWQVIGALLGVPLSGVDAETRAQLAAGGVDAFGEFLWQVADAAGVAPASGVLTPELAEQLGLLEGSPLVGVESVPVGRGWELDSNGDPVDGDTGGGVLQVPPAVLNNQRRRRREFGDLDLSDGDGGLDPLELSVIPAASAEELAAAFGLSQGIAPTGLSGPSVESYLTLLLGQGLIDQAVHDRIVADPVLLAGLAEVLASDGTTTLSPAGQAALELVSGPVTQTTGLSIGSVLDFMLANGLITQADYDFVTSDPARLQVLNEELLTAGLTTFLSETFGAVDQLFHSFLLPSGRIDVDATAGVLSPGFDASKGGPSAEQIAALWAAARGSDGRFVELAGNWVLLHSLRLGNGVHLRFGTDPSTGRHNVFFWVGAHPDALPFLNLLIHGLERARLEGMKSGSRKAKPGTSFAVRFEFELAAGGNDIDRRGRFRNVEGRARDYLDAIGFYHGNLAVARSQMWPETFGERGWIRTRKRPGDDYGFGSYRKDEDGRLYRDEDGYYYRKGKHRPLDGAEAYEGRDNAVDLDDSHVWRGAIRQASGGIAPKAVATVAEELFGTAYTIVAGAIGAKIEALTTYDRNTVVILDTDDVEVDLGDTNSANTVFGLNSDGTSIVGGAGDLLVTVGGDDVVTGFTLDDDRYGLATNTTVTVTTDLTDATIDHDGGASTTLINADVTKTTITGDDGPDTVIVGPDASLTDSTVDLGIDHRASDGLGTGQGGDGDTFVNQGTVTDVTIDLGLGNDTVSFEEGSLTVDTTVDLGDGNDQATIAGSGDGVTIDVGTSKGGQDQIFVLPTADGDWKLIDDHESWAWADGEGGVRNETALIAVGDGWSFDNGRLTRTDPDTGESITLTVEGDGGFEKVRAVDPDTGETIATFRDIDPEIRRQAGWLGIVGKVLIVAGAVVAIAVTAGAATPAAAAATAAATGTAAAATTATAAALTTLKLTLTAVGSTLLATEQAINGADFFTVLGTVASGFAQVPGGVGTAATGVTAFTKFASNDPIGGVLAGLNFAANVDADLTGIDVSDSFFTDLGDYGSAAVLVGEGIAGNGINIGRGLSLLGAEIAGDDTTTNRFLLAANDTLTAINAVETGNLAQLLYSAGSFLDRTDIGLTTVDTGITNPATGDQLQVTHNPLAGAFIGAGGIVNIIDALEDGTNFDHTTLINGLQSITNATGMIIEPDLLDATTITPVTSSNGTDYLVIPGANGTILIADSDGQPLFTTSTNPAGDIITTALDGTILTITNPDGDITYQDDPNSPFGLTTLNTDFTLPDDDALFYDGPNPFNPEPDQTNPDQSGTSNSDVVAGLRSQIEDGLARAEDDGAVVRGLGDEIGPGDLVETIDGSVGVVLNNGMVGYLDNDGNVVVESSALAGGALAFLPGEAAKVTELLTQAKDAAASRATGTPPPSGGGLARSLAVALAPLLTSDGAQYLDRLSQYVPWSVTTNEYRSASLAFSEYAPNLDPNQLTTTQRGELLIGAAVLYDAYQAGELSRVGFERGLDQLAQSFSASTDTDDDPLTRPFIEGIPVLSEEEMSEFLGSFVQDGPYDFDNSVSFDLGSWDPPPPPPPPFGYSGDGDGDGDDDGSSWWATLLGGGGALVGWNLLTTSTSVFTAMEQQEALLDLQTGWGDIFLDGPVGSLIRVTKDRIEDNPITLSYDGVLAYANNVLGAANDSANNTRAQANIDAANLRIEHHNLGIALTEYGHNIEVRQFNVDVLQRLRNDAAFETRISEGVFTPEWYDSQYDDLVAAGVPQVYEQITGRAFPERGSTELHDVITTDGSGFLSYGGVVYYPDEAAYIELRIPQLERPTGGNHLTQDIPGQQLPISYQPVGLTEVRNHLIATGRLDADQDVIPPHLFISGLEDLTGVAIPNTLATFSEARFSDNGIDQLEVAALTELSGSVNLANMRSHSTGTDATEMSIMLNAAAFLRFELDELETALNNDPNLRQRFNEALARGGSFEDFVASLPADTYPVVTSIFSPGSFTPPAGTAWAAAQNSIDQYQAAVERGASDEELAALAENIFVVYRNEGISLPGDAVSTRAQEKSTVGSYIIGGRLDERGAPVANVVITQENTKTTVNLLRLAFGSNTFGFQLDLTGAEADYVVQLAEHFSTSLDYIRQAQEGRFNVSVQDVLDLNLGIDATNTQQIQAAQSELALIRDVVKLNDLTDTEKDIRLGHLVRDDGGVYTDREGMQQRAGQQLQWANSTRVNDILPGVNDNRTVAEWYRDAHGQELTADLLLTEAVSVPFVRSIENGSGWYVTALMVDNVTSQHNQYVTLQDFQRLPDRPENIAIDDSQINAATTRDEYRAAFNNELIRLGQRTGIDVSGLLVSENTLLATGEDLEVLSQLRIRTGANLALLDPNARAQEEGILGENTGRYTNEQQNYAQVTSSLFNELEAKLAAGDPEARAFVDALKNNEAVPTTNRFAPLAEVPAADSSRTTNVLPGILETGDQVFTNPPENVSLVVSDDVTVVQAGFGGALAEKFLQGVESIGQGHLAVETVRHGTLFNQTFPVGQALETPSSLAASQQALDEANGQVITFWQLERNEAIRTNNTERRLFAEQQIAHAEAQTNLNRAVYENTVFILQQNSREETRRSFQDDLLSTGLTDQLGVQKSWVDQIKANPSLAGLTPQQADVLATLDEQGKIGWGPDETFVALTPDGLRVFWANPTQALPHSVSDINTLTADVTSTTPNEPGSVQLVTPPLLTLDAIGGLTGPQKLNVLNQYVTAATGSEASFVLSDNTATSIEANELLSFAAKADGDLKAFVAGSLAGTGSQPSADLLRLGSTVIENGKAEIGSIVTVRPDLALQIERGGLGSLTTQQRGEFIATFPTLGKLFFGQQQPPESELETGGSINSDDDFDQFADTTRRLGETVGVGTGLDPLSIELLQEAAAAVGVLGAYDVGYLSDLADSLGLDTSTAIDTSLRNNLQVSIDRGLATENNTIATENEQLGTDSATPNATQQRLQDAEEIDARNQLQYQVKPASVDRLNIALSQYVTGDKEAYVTDLANRTVEINGRSYRVGDLYYRQTGQQLNVDNYQNPGVGKPALVNGQLVLPQLWLDTIIVHSMQEPVDVGVSGVNLTQVGEVTLPPASGIDNQLDNAGNAGVTNPTADPIVVTASDQNDLLRYVSTLQAQANAIKALLTPEQANQVQQALNHKVATVLQNPDLRQAAVAIQQGNGSTVTNHAALQPLVNSDGTLNRDALGMSSSALPGVDQVWRDGVINVDANAANTAFDQLQDNRITVVGLPNDRWRTYFGVNDGTTRGDTTPPPLPTEVEQTTTERPLIDRLLVPDADSKDLSQPLTKVGSSAVLFMIDANAYRSNSSRFLKATIDDQGQVFYAEVTQQALVDQAQQDVANEITLAQQEAQIANQLGDADRADAANANVVALSNYDTALRTWNTRLDAFSANVVNQDTLASIVSAEPEVIATDVQHERWSRTPAAGFPGMTVADVLRRPDGSLPQPDGYTPIVTSSGQVYWPESAANQVIRDQLAPPQPPSLLTSDAETVEVPPTTPTTTGLGIDSNTTTGFSGGDRHSAMRNIVSANADQLDVRTFMRNVGQATATRLVSAQYDDVDDRVSEDIANTLGNADAEGAVKAHLSPDGTYNGVTTAEYLSRLEPEQRTTLQRRYLGDSLPTPQDFGVNVPIADYLPSATVRRIGTAPSIDVNLGYTAFVAAANKNIEEVDLSTSLVQNQTNGEYSLVIETSENVQKQASVINSVNAGLISENQRRIELNQVALDSAGRSNDELQAAQTQLQAETTAYENREAVYDSKTSGYAAAAEHLRTDPEAFARNQAFLDASGLGRDGAAYREGSDPILLGDTVFYPENSETKERIIGTRPTLSGSGDTTTTTIDTSLLKPIDAASVISPGNPEKTIRNLDQALKAQGVELDRASLNAIETELSTAQAVSVINVTGADVSFRLSSQGDTDSSVTAIDVPELIGDDVIVDLPPSDVNSVPVEGERVIAARNFLREDAAIVQGFASDSVISPERLLLNKVLVSAGQGDYATAQDAIADLAQINRGLADRFAIYADENATLDDWVFRQGSTYIGDTIVPVPTPGDSPDDTFLSPSLPPLPDIDGDDSTDGNGLGSDGSVDVDSGEVIDTGNGGLDPHSIRIQRNDGESEWLDPQFEQEEIDQFDDDYQP